MESIYPPAPPDPIQQASNILRSELVGFFQVDQVVSRSSGRIIDFSGQFLGDPDDNYQELHRRFGAHGYTPLFRRKNGRDVVQAVEGVVSARRTGNPLINLLLLLATVATTLMAGSQMMGHDLWRALTTGSIPVIFQAVLAGAPFTITLLGILGIHELGHYVAARLHGVQATLPYFIPMPLGLGTLGAFIAIRSPMRNRKVLFDIGLAGPIAGFVAAVPLFLLGLLLAADDVVAVGYPARTINSLGSSALVSGLVNLVYDLPANRTLLLNPVYFAAWLGFFLTGINLLPVGQLDGGHATYALAGRFAHILGIVTFVALIIAGITLSPNWYVWAFFVMLGGLRHPPPLNDITGVGLPRALIGLAMIVLFILVLTPVPFR